MNILFVVEHYYPYIGGAETLFQLLAESLAEYGHQVTVVTTRFNKELQEDENVNKVRVIRINCANRYLFSFLSLPPIIPFAKKADVIHTTSYNAALPAWIAGKITRKKVIITFHEVWAQLWFRLPFAPAWIRTGYYLFEQFILKLPFDHYIAVSDFTKESLLKQGIKKDKISRIYNGLHYEKFATFQHQPPPQFTYTYFGRLGISKGLNLLLAAAAQFQKEFPDSVLVLVLPKRPAPIYKKVMDLIEELDLSDYIRLRHELSQKELYQQIQQSSCVVIPSHSEGFCFVAAEAVAIGVPIVSSGKGALKETVSGKMIEVETLDAVGIFEALKKAQAGSWEEKQVERFEMQESVSQYLDLYNKIES